MYKIWVILFTINFLQCFKMLIKLTINLICDITVLKIINYRSNFSLGLRFKSDNQIQFIKLENVFKNLHKNINY